MSRSLNKTLREAGGDVASKAHELLFRAGVIHEPFSGHVSFPPVGLRVLRRIEAVVRQELERIGCNEISVTHVVGREVCERSGRREKSGEIMAVSGGEGIGRGGDEREGELGGEGVAGSISERVGERTGEWGCLAGEPHEAVCLLARSLVQSYKDLPAALFEIERRLTGAEGGRLPLVSDREPVLANVWSLCAAGEQEEETAEELERAFGVAMERCGLGDVVRTVRASGRVGWYLTAEGGSAERVGKEGRLAPERLVVCTGCGAVADQRWARVKKEWDGLVRREAEKERSEVHTPSVKTIEELSRFLGVEPERCLKCVLYESRGGLVIAVIRGDLEVSDFKVGERLGGEELWMADDEVVRRAGVVGGFASPIGVGEQVRVIVDDSVHYELGYVAGANREDYHLVDVVPERDFPSHLEVVDIALAREGGRCERCGGRVREEGVLELARLQLLGTEQAERLGARFNRKDGKSDWLKMVHGGVSASRLMLAIAASHHDENGIVWPKEIAPWDVHIVRIGKSDEELDGAVDELEADLWGAGLRPLVDDRRESPGVKLNDADLLGVPMRLVVSRRNLKDDVVELKVRDEPEKRKIPREQVVARVRELWTHQ
jgi:prolyl-tRNA synthetase